MTDHIPVEEATDLEPVVNNLPLKSVSHAGFTIEGYSRGAVQTYWRIPELKIGFDLGGSPWAFMGTPTYFISHPHLDHMAALPPLVARRRMMKMDPPKIYVPAEVREDTWNLLKAWQKLDRGRMHCDLIGVEPGEEYELSREHVMTVVKTKHTVPSVGYVIWDRRKKLKPEYQGLTGDEIRDIRLSGTEVSHEIRFPLVTYLGDTTPAPLDQYEEVLQSKILITEMTFFRPEHRKAKIHKFGHTHLDDIIERAEKFENEMIILAHFSTRYHTSHLKRAVMKRLPESLKDRVVLWT